MATASILARSAKETGEGVPLYLVVRHQGSRAMMSLSLRVQPTHWNAEKKEVRRSHPDFSQLNELLRTRLSEARREINRRRAEDGDLSPVAIKRALQDEEEPERGFVAYCRDKVREYRRRGQANTAAAYRTAVRHLEEFLEAEHATADVPITSVDGAIISEMKTWLTEEKGNKPNTIHKKLGSLHTLWNRARKEGHIEKGAPDPWDAVTLRKEQSNKEKLTTDEIRRLEDLQLSGRKKDVQQWFLFMFYAGGMRVSDICLLRRKHLRQDEDGRWRCRYRMKKTRQSAGVLLVDEAISILEDYDFQEKDPDQRVFPILDGYDLSTEEKQKKAIGARTSLMNKYLKEMAAAAGIDKTVTTHIARHSLAAYLYEELGYDIYTIRDILGHANVRITQTYLDGFDYSTSDEAMEQVSLRQDN
ncbi:site-specific integrase [Salinibacter altiplanensis]|uniref:site-specific integrase n=1 Tax=Salinibacter altiplanensis TaxID=1803181 RepID=UPI000C9F0331|nr:site-specific integrase [Salinibacter altiplanensis]